VIAGGAWGLASFPFAAAVIAGVFAARLGWRFGRKRRAYEGHWALALAMFAVASAATFLGVLDRWSGTEFRVYWLFGAVLNVPFLFLGEFQLLVKSRSAGVALALLLYALSVLAAVQVWSSPLHIGALSDRLPLGKDVFGDGSLPYRLAQYYALPAYFLLLGGLVWSAWQMRRNAALKDRTVGTLAIALGASIVAIGSGIGAAFHVVPLFSVALAAGVAVMFWGFLRAGRPVSAALPSAAQPIA
jgi:hypothetical protein